MRTPVTTFRGSFVTLSSVDLGSFVAKEALHRAGKLKPLFLPYLGIKSDEVEETIAGSVLTAGLGQNVARQIAIKSGTLRLI